MKVEVLKYAAVPVQMNVKKDQLVVILTDSKVDSSIHEALVAAVYGQKATPILIVIPPLDSYGNEPPKAASEALLQADIVLTACSTSMTHTDAIRNTLKKGIPMIAMGGITVDSLTQGASAANYDEVREISKRVEKALENSDKIKVTSENGTNISFSLKDRPLFPLTGHLDGGGIASFPGGEVATAPVEGTANGRIVVDGTMHHIGTVETPIVLDLSNGRVVNIEGGEEADQLKKFLDNNGDENSYNLAEFAMGTNPNARLTADSQETKRKLGTIHFAIGDNQTLGGHTYSKTHLDGLLLKPSVWVNERLILDRGTLLNIGKD